ncbi:hypothetical protein MJH12_01315 [bacterium]|nr:hypothetical protein [bacterium]
MQFKRFKYLVILTFLFLSACDKQEQAPIQNNSDQEIEMITDSEPIEDNHSSPVSTNDVLLDARKVLQDHDQAPNNDEVISQDNTSASNDLNLSSDISTQVQCGDNGQFFEGIESSYDCLDTEVRLPQNNESSQKIALCYFNQNTIRGSKLKTSKWGTIGHIQRALQLKADGVFGLQTKNALQTYLKLDSLHCLSEAQYNKITQKQSADLKQKASNFSYMMEGTDYDVLEFNYGYNHIDPSGATWGPSGMTLRSGEISKILQIALSHQDLVDILSTNELSLLTQLSKQSGSQAKSLVKKLVWNKGKSARQQMKALFKRMAQVDSVRAAFDQVSYGSIQSKLRHYETFLKKYENVSELDWAMFYDIAIQTGRTQTKVKALLKQAPPNKYSDSQKRRQAWAKIISKEVSSRWQEDRYKRSMLFVGKNSLARAFGISDQSIDL